MAKKIPLVVEIGARDRFSGKLAKISQKLAAFGGKLKGAGRSMTASLTLPAGLAAAGIVKVGADFEQSMNRARAVMGLIGPETEGTFQKMRTAAKELGISTEKSATQAAEALTFLGMAGFDTEKSIAALPGVIDLSTIAQIELAEATDIATNILTGYDKEASELGDVNDVLVATFTKSNTSLVELGESFKLVAPLAATMNIPIAEMAALQGKLGDQGIKATLSGTTLRRAMVNLISPTAEALSTFEKLGIDQTEIKDSEGRLNSLVAVFEKLNEAGAKSDDILAIFGARAGPSLIKLIESGLPSIRGLQAEIEKSGGITKKVAKIFRSGAAGAFAELRSAVEGLGIAIGESGLLQDVTQLAKRFTAWFREMAAADPEKMRLGVKIAAITITIGPLVFALGLLASSFNALVVVMNLVLIKFAAFIVIKTVTLGFTALVAAVGALKIAFVALFAGGALGPIALVTALSAAGILLYENWDFVSAKLTEIFEGIKDMLTGVIFEIDNFLGITEKLKSLGGLTDFVFGTEEKVTKNIDDQGLGEALAGAAASGFWDRPEVQKQSAFTRAKVDTIDIKKQSKVNVDVKFDNLPRGARVQATSSPDVALETSQRSGMIMGDS